MAERRVFLVRAVNVGGTAKLPMAEWRAIAEDVGASDVRTYIGSGNLICTPPANVEAFERELERAVEERFGFFREVVSRSREQLVDARGAFPFGDNGPKFAYVTFLSWAPSEEGVAAAREVATGYDTWELAASSCSSATASGRATRTPA